MKVTIEELERYLEGRLSPGKVRAVEAMLRRSPLLAAQVAALREERKLMSEIRDAQSLRPAEEDERRIVSKVGERLTTLLDGARAP